MKKDTKVETISLSAISADENQPRKHFAAERLSDLMKSISAHGIMNPLIVEDLGNGKYMLVDGERRFRAAHELKLKEVPALVVAAQSATQRLIQQFHLQEQHQSWSATEKAVAVAELATQLKTTVKSISETLAIPTRTIGDYVAFAKLVDRSAFQKSEISISYAEPIVALRTFIKNIWRDHDMEFTRDMERGLEKAIIARIKDGTITRPSNLARLKDAVRASPNSITKFISGNISLDKLFTESKGKAAYFYRHTIGNCRYLAFSIDHGLKAGMEEFFTEDNADARGTLKAAAIKLKKLLDIIE